MAEVVNSESSGQTGPLNRWAPDAPSEVGAAQRLSLGRCEHKGLWIVVHPPEEVLCQELSEEVGDHNHPTAMGLGGAEIQCAPHICERLNHLDLRAEKLASFPTDRGCFTPPEPAVGEQIDHRPIRPLNRSGKPLYLFG